MRIQYFFIFILLISLYGCSKIRDSAGVNRKTIDEYQVIENPPLVIPPDFNLMPPDQLEEKKIEDVEKELAQDILFGLDENNIDNNNQTSTMSEILKESEALDVSSNIRKEINDEFSNEIDSDQIFQIDWDNEVEVLDAVKESECIRNKIFENKSITECDVATKSETIKKKKKKRFFFF